MARTAPPSYRPPARPLSRRLISHRNARAPRSEFHGRPSPIILTTEHTHTHTQARATIKEANKQTSTQSWLQMEPPGRLDGWRRRKASAIVGSDSPTRPPLIRRPPPFFLSTPSDRIRHPTNISFGTCFARVEQTEILELAIGIGNNRQSISHSSSPPFRSTPFSMSQ